MRVAGQGRRWRVTIAAVAVTAVIAIVSGCPTGLGDHTGTDPETNPVTYTVSYDANGANSGTVPEAQTKTPGENLTVAGNSGNLERIGYAFDGWNTTDDGTGGDYAEGATYTTDADLTLYANWTPLQVGDLGPAGGLVFYDKGEYIDGWRYLEAAPVETEWTSKPWGGRGNAVGAAAQGQAIGTGAGNTLSIVLEYGDAEPDDGRDDYAANLSAGLGHGGYDDWFLPSLKELNVMHDNLHLQGMGGFASVRYWSSSEGTANGAWGQDFSDGLDVYFDKNLDFNVRAVRAF